MSLSENEIDELKRYYNKYKQYTQQELKKKKANEIISNCTHECESSTLDKTKHKRNYLPPSANKTINDMDDDVPQDRLVSNNNITSTRVSNGGTPNRETIGEDANSTNENEINPTDELIQYFIKNNSNVCRIIPSIERRERSESNRDMDPLECYNCKRQQIVTSPHARLEDDNDYLIFYPLQKQDVNNRRKFRNFCLSGDSEEQTIVCLNYHQYLTIENTKTASQHKHVWPSFMWNLLINKDIHDVYGSNIWKLFPMNWRRWWINTIPQVPCFHNITMDSPPAKIVDKSTDLSEFNHDIATGVLATISKTINKHLMPTILCP